ncbi:MAG: AMP-binding protein [Sulfurimonas sp.]|uniref:AMP-binding protein n=1 Tax=Sulfurimonas sp. TaxID=2022749 RepID=UPI0025F34D2E|nr:AMP-binding protein [Sulfurimonas sp.]MCK9492335.1 AMP-binding protein [Sulfurimonas sp.]
MTYPYENLNNFTLRDLLNRSIELYAETDVLSKLSETPMTYKEFGQKVQEMTKLLQKNGISHGDKVLLLSQNMPNWAIAYFSVTYIGAVIVPVLPDFHPSEVLHILRHSEAKAAFVSRKHLSTLEESSNTDLEFAIELDSLKIIDESIHKSHLSELAKKTKEMAQKFSNTSPKVPKEDDLAAIIYTSGTTGHSKGVMLSHKNIVTNALSTYSILEITKDDVFLSILPLAHTYECTVGLIVPILHGSSVVYIDKTPTPSVLLKAFELVKPTMILSVPLIIEKIYKNKILPKFTSSFIMRNLYKNSFIRKKLNKIAGKKLLETFGGRLKFFGIGGAALSPFVEKFLLEAEFPYTVGYGLTETAPLLAGTNINLTPKFKSTGPAFYGVELKIKDPDPITKEGEIIAKSPSLMLGYYKDKEQTEEVIRDGWLHTGDLGFIDEDGYLFIRGRSKNVIIGADGKNIYPEQLESIINQNEAVLDSLVLEQNSKLVARIHLDYELLDERFNASKTSDLKVKDEITNLLEELRLDVNNQVASSSKMIKFIEQIEPFVKTPTKKIKRYIYVE